MILAHNGITVPRLGLGTWQLTEEDCLNSVPMALDIGYRHIDTAQIYGNEAEVGKAMAKSTVSRGDIFLTTKVWRDRVGATFEDSVNTSLNKLGTDYVDLLLIHWPVEEVPLDEQLHALHAVQKAGKARLIGVSNYTVEWLNRALEMGISLATNQVEYHAQLSQKPVLETLRENNMFLTAYSPLGRGRLLKNEVLGAIASAHNTAPAAVLLAWLLAQDDVVAIPKSTSRSHLEANFAAQHVTLSADDIAQLDTLTKPDGRMINPGFSAKWDTGVGQPVV
ncbi:MAG: 2,5-diketo-D-gluconate reductase B [Myxococcota bacterium]|jgi:2,5-diketo-D-gluconate reductase B